MTRVRDRRTNSALRRAGWRVILIWECQLRPKGISRVVERLWEIASVNRRVKGGMPEKLKEGMQKFCPRTRDHQHHKIKRK